MYWTSTWRYTGQQVFKSRDFLLCHRPLFPSYHPPHIHPARYSLQALLLHCFASSSNTFIYQVAHCNMFKATIISTFCALLLADASLAAAISRDCRALHQDAEYPDATAAVTCDWVPASTSTDLTSTESSTESTSTEPTGSSTGSWTEEPTSTNTWSSTEETTSSCTESTSAEPTQTPPAQPQPTEPSEQPYQGKFYQISPAANSSMCLSALVTWEGTIGRSDLVNLYVVPIEVNSSVLLIRMFLFRRPCECDEPDVQNLWTFERSDEQTTIMIGKPKSAFDTTWCLDGRLSTSWLRLFALQLQIADSVNRSQ